MENQINKNWNTIVYYAVRIFGIALPYFIYILHKKYKTYKRIHSLKIVSEIIPLSKYEAEEREKIIKEINYVLYLSILKHKKYNIKSYL